MKLIRHVPLSSGLTAAAETTNHSIRDDPDNQEFHTWYNAPRYGHRSVLDCPSVTVDQARELLADVPMTPVGVAWKNAVEVSLGMTLADIDRPYDDVQYDDKEKAIAEELDSFAETLREHSPLLDDIAGVIEDQAMSASFDIGDLREQRARITDDGIVIGTRGYCDKHDEDCYGDNRRVATWEHLNGIYPTLQATLIGILTRLDAEIPEMGENDNGRARYAHARD